MEHHNHHEEEEEHGRLFKILAAAVILIIAVIIEKRTDWATWQYLLLFLVPYLVVGLDTLKEALGDKVSEVVISSKLVDAPVCVSTKDGLSLDIC